MSIPPSNRESETRPTTNPVGHGMGKELNPDRTPISAMPGGGTQVAEMPSRREDRTDEQLLAGYRGGDRASFAELVNRYQRELFHFLVRFLGDRAAAEDVFQETFLQVHQSADQFDPE